MEEELNTLDYVWIEDFADWNLYFQHGICIKIDPQTDNYLVLINIDNEDRTRDLDPIEMIKLSELIYEYFLTRSIKWIVLQNYEQWIFDGGFLIDKEDHICNCPILEMVLTSIERAYKTKAVRLPAIYVATDEEQMFQNYLNKLILSKFKNYTRFSHDDAFCLSHKYNGINKVKMENLLHLEGFALDMNFTDHEYDSDFMIELLKSTTRLRFLSIDYSFMTIPGSLDALSCNYSLLEIDFHEDLSSNVNYNHYCDRNRKIRKQIEKASLTLLMLRNRSAYSLLHPIDKNVIKIICRLVFEQRHEIKYLSVFAKANK